MTFNRRTFIRCASLAAAGQLAGLGPFGALNSLAQTTGDYKALVCIFLFGGNDSNNMLVPFDASGYSNYSTIRGSLALPQSSLLQLATAPAFSVHPNLTELKTLFDGGKAAFVANVGTLPQPLTRAQYLDGTKAKPANLFSHSDQQSEWQNGTANSLIFSGWAGRIADQYAPLMNGNGQIPLITSVAGGTLFTNGNSSSPLAVTPGNLLSVTCSEGTECTPRLGVAQQIINFTSGLSLVQADNAITGRAYGYTKALASAVQSAASLQTVFPKTSLGTQLKQIAQIMQVRQALGINRQIFFAGLGGFDTHVSQLAAQTSLYTQLSQAMAAFYQATQELVLENQVTTFTMSDFSRTMQPNTDGGTDHAWGGHQLVMGGAVKGGSIYGSYPTLALGGPDDMGTAGRWIPTTSSTQYAATLSKWFGVPAPELGSVFPAIGNFSNPLLSFLV